MFKLSVNKILTLENSLAKDTFNEIRAFASDSFMPTLLRWFFCLGAVVSWVNRYQLFGTVVCLFLLFDKRKSISFTDISKVCCGKGFYGRIFFLAMLNQQYDNYVECLEPFVDVWFSVVCDLWAAGSAPLCMCVYIYICVWNLKLKCEGWVYILFAFCPSHRAQSSSLTRALSVQCW